ERRTLEREHRERGSRVPRQRAELARTAGERVEHDPAVRYEPGELRALRAEVAEQAPNANRALSERRQRAAQLLGGVGRGGSAPQREQSRAQLGSSRSVEEAERVVDLD